VRTAGNNVGDYPFLIGTLATPFDYTIRFTSDSALSITPKMLSVNSVTASNKIYDGNTTATVSGSGLTGVINGDDVTLAGVSGTFDTKHAGTGKTVTISGGSLSGAGAGNYQIGSTAATTTANITKKELGVVTVSADDKVYDGTRTATLSFGASTGVVAGDDVSLSGLAGTFDNKDVGTGQDCDGHRWQPHRHRCWQLPNHERCRYNHSGYQPEGTELFQLDGGQQGVRRQYYGQREFWW
jgi:hypothetical protein